MRGRSTGRRRSAMDAPPNLVATHRGRDRGADLAWFQGSRPWDRTFASAATAHAMSRMGQSVLSRHGGSCFDGCWESVRITHIAALSCPQCGHVARLKSIEPESHAVLRMERHTFECPDCGLPRSYRLRLIDADASGASAQGERHSSTRSLSD